VTSGPGCARLAFILSPGASRQRLERALNSAYAEGVLSENTLVHRLELLFRGPLVDPARLVGDLPERKRQRLVAPVFGRMREAVRDLRSQRVTSKRSSSVLLALDWNGGQEELVIGRHPHCDVVLPGPAVSPRHARLRFRDGTWILEDLESTNGTVVNGAPLVGRCRLEPGDRLLIGDERLLVD
jgi:hypothetical protein